MESMTGFASFSTEKDLSWTWTLRSVNGKGLEIRCRLPAGYDLLEQEIREILRKTFARGNISVSLDFKSEQRRPALQINRELLSELCHMATTLQEKFPQIRPASLDGLLNIRGVVEQPENTENNEEIKALFSQSFVSAAQALKQARLAEGAKITEVLNDQVSKIEELVGQARSLAAAQPEKIRQNLKANLDLIKETSDLSEERFMQEVTACMLRADVREELDRLAAHVRTARELFAENGPVGRKLDFLCQEFNREANTLCSKSADIELTRTGMALKTVIDQLREQIQNIE